MKFNLAKCFLGLVLSSAFLGWQSPLAAAQAQAAEETPWVVFEGKSGPGQGKHIVLLAGDEEYRSEESMPMLARILAERHGFKCTVLFSTNKETGLIDPEEQTNVPGMHFLDEADMLVCFFRFRELPDEDMAHFVKYVEAGKPILGIRTATHAFSYSRDKESPYARYTWAGGPWDGGFGRQILGETWISHHGHHGKQSTRGLPEAANKMHPVLTGVRDVWGPTDVYGIKGLPEDATVLLRGQVLTGMDPDSSVLEGPKNAPMMPIAWSRELPRANGNTQRIICSTIGASVDCKSADLRRLFVNACYWGMGMEQAIDGTRSVEVVGSYEPTMFGFGKYTRGVRASDFRLPGDDGK